MPFRAFISVDIGARPELVKVVEELKKIRGDLKLVKPEHLHLTLKFLGETPEELIPRIVEVMERSVKDVNQFKIKLQGMGAFPSLSYIRVVWIGIKRGGRLIKIAKSLEEELPSLGFRREKRKFSPHLTVARVKSAKSKEKLREFLTVNKENDFGEFDVAQIRLKKSVLSAKGPQYSTMKEVKL